MTHTDSHGSEDRRAIILRAAGAGVAAFLAVLLLGTIVAGLAGSAAATDAVSTHTPTPTPTPTPSLDERAPMHNNTTSTPDQAGWLAGRSDPTLENIAALATRFGGFIVGTPQGGTIVGSALMVALIVAGMAGGALAQPNVGMVAGGVALLVLLWGLSTTGYAPLWLYAVGLILLGAVSGAALIRVLR